MKLLYTGELNACLSVLCQIKISMQKKVKIVTEKKDKVPLGTLSFF